MSVYAFDTLRGMVIGDVFYGTGATREEAIAEAEVAAKTELQVDTVPNQSLTAVSGYLLDDSGEPTEVVIWTAVLTIRG